MSKAIIFGTGGGGDVAYRFPTRDSVVKSQYKL